jgi:hypothetical protein
MVGGIREFGVRGSGFGVEVNSEFGIRNSEGFGVSPAETLCERGFSCGDATRWRSLSFGQTGLLNLEFGIWRVGDWGVKTLKD